MIEIISVIICIYLIIGLIMDVTLDIKYNISLDNLSGENKYKYIPFAVTKFLFKKIQQSNIVTIRDIIKIFFICGTDAVMFIGYTVIGIIAAIINFILNIKLYRKK